MLSGAAVLHDKTNSNLPRSESSVPTFFSSFDTFTTSTDETFISKIENVLESVYKWTCLPKRNNEQYEEIKVYVQKNLL